LYSHHIELNLQSSEIKKDNEDNKNYKEFVDTNDRAAQMLKALKNDWKTLKRLISFKKDSSNFIDIWNERRNIIPRHCDVLIIGGGAIGSSIAYWLRQKFYREEFSVVVVEKDPTVRN